MKRFSETEKWDDPWFQELAPPAKLLFLFIIDRCNNAGFLEVNEAGILHHTRMDPRALPGAWRDCSKGIIVRDGWAWVRRFLRHQKNDKLNPLNPAHRQILTLLSDQSKRFAEVPQFGDFIAPYKGLLSPIGTGNGNGSGGGRGAGEGDPPPIPPSDPPRRPRWYPEVLRNPEFERLFTEWEDHKRSQGYPITVTARPHVLGRLAAAGPGVACAVLERSLAESASKLLWDEPRATHSSRQSKPPRTANPHQPTLEELELERLKQ